MVPAREAEMQSYEELLEAGRKRDAELDQVGLTREELDRIETESRPVALGTEKVASGHTYCIGGLFREEDGVVRSSTRCRNISASAVRRKLVAFAMQESTVRVEHWIEAF
jgi:hypothetical protein